MPGADPGRRAIPSAERRQAAGGVQLQELRRVQVGEQSVKRR